MYQRVGQSAYKADLAATLSLALHLDNPENSFKSIHVAGTNGKGSTSHMLASIFQEAGYKTGLYTSPHLIDFRERIKIDGKLIPKKNVSDFVLAHKGYFEENQLSFFEMTVGLAFDYFKKEKVDIAIVEVGMGGRLDSTNIITPEISIITNIGLDHTQFLGNSLESIAAEKAGIIKSGIPVIIGESTAETKVVFQKTARERNAQIYFAECSDTLEYESDLKGNYQKKNKRIVVQAIRILKENGWQISEENVVDGFAKTVNNTGLRGRWEVLQEHPKVIVDTAHNREGLTIVMEQLQMESFKDLHIVLGMVIDKDLTSVLPLFPKNATYYFCTPNVPRGMNANILYTEAKIYGLHGNVFKSVNDAYINALENASSADVVYIGGSTFVVAEVL